jgi:transposase
MTKPEKILTDDLWEIIEPMLPKQKAPGTPGRPKVPNRKAMLGILYVLLNSCAWNAIPKGYGSGPTCWRRFKEWKRNGVWKRILKVMLERVEPNARLALTGSSSVQATKRGALRAPNRQKGRKTERRGAR